jgi:dephospho-CoA kinase
MIRLGLTGSIATGKSTTAQLFADEGVPVHDADAAVHAIYRQEGVAPVGALIPTAIVDNVVDREALKKALAEDPSLFPSWKRLSIPWFKSASAALPRTHWQTGMT